MDAQGNVQLNGRTKELINRGGVKFNPIDMEIAISTHPAVAQVSIAPLPDPTLGERASCFVVLKSGAALEFEELKAFLAEQKFAKFTWPEHFAVVKEMPMTPTRKVMKAELVRQYLTASERGQGASYEHFLCRFRNRAPRSNESSASASAKPSRSRTRRRGIAASSMASTPTSSIRRTSGSGSRFSTRKRCASSLTPNFCENFCVIPTITIAEYWRSGGSTGQPVFYPRTKDDVRYAELSWGRSFPCMGIGPGDLCHIAFPLGVHPAGQVWARSAQMFGVGMIWVGAGNAYPSAGQLDLIQTLRPTVFIGMSSFALHLANLAEAKGIDLAASSVRKLVCSAETLSAAKREKLARMWGAEVFDVFGMSEAGLMGAETSAHDGIHIWTDMFFIEVVDTRDRQIAARGRGRHAVRNATLDQSCNAVPAMEFR